MPATSGPAVHRSVRDAIGAAVRPLSTAGEDTPQRGRGRPCAEHTGAGGACLSTAVVWART